MNKKFIILIVLALIIIAGGMIFFFQDESPTDVARAFYRAGNEGNYTRAKGYLAPEARMVFKMEMGGTILIPRFDKAMDAATKGRTITQIEVVEKVEHPGYVIVMLTLYYADGSQAQDFLQLRKVDGQWRILQSTLLLAAPAGAPSLFDIPSPIEIQRMIDDPVPVPTRPPVDLELRRMDEFAWSPDNKKIAYINRYGNLVVAKC